MLEKLTEARVGVSVAEAQKADALAALNRIESRFGKVRDAFAVAAVLALVLFGLFLIIRAALAATATKPAGAGRPYIAGALAVVTCGMLVLAMVTTLGTNANSTFSFVGSSIK